MFRVPTQNVFLAAHNSECIKQNDNMTGFWKGRGQPNSQGLFSSHPLGGRKKRDPGTRLQRGGGSRGRCSYEMKGF